MAFEFPLAPEDNDSVAFEGRTWTFDAERQQWLSSFSDPNQSNIKDIGFEYNATSKEWHLDVGVMVNV